MNTYKQKGNVLSLIAPGGGVTSGVPVIIEDMTVIPATTAAAAAEFEGAVEGVYEVPKTAAETWKAGEILYWDSGTGFATNVAGALFKMGLASAPVAATIALGNCKLER